MRKHRTISQHTVIIHGKKEHCPQDHACGGCCSCVQQYINQNKILKEKTVKITKEKEESQQLIIRLNKSLRQWEGRKAQFDKIDQFKLKVRSLIKKEIQEQKKAEQFIIKQKIQNAKREKKQFEEIKKKLEQEINQKQKETKHFKNQLLILNERLENLQRQLKRKDLGFQQAEVLRTAFEQKQNYFQRIIREKTSNIDRIQNALSQTEQIFITEKVKAKNNEFEVLRHLQQLKAKKIQLVSLQKTAKQKNTSINHLNIQKEKLNKLVVELDSTVHSYSQLSNKLRERIIVSEDYALQKQIQCKQLEMDFYDSIYQRHSSMYQSK